MGLLVDVFQNGIIIASSAGGIGVMLMIALLVIWAIALIYESLKPIIDIFDGKFGFWDSSEENTCDQPNGMGDQFPILTQTHGLEFPGLAGRTDKTGRKADLAAARTFRRFEPVALGCFAMISCCYHFPSSM